MTASPPPRRPEAAHKAFRSSALFAAAILSLCVAPARKTAAQAAAAAGQPAAAATAPQTPSPIAGLGKNTAKPQPPAPDARSKDMKVPAANMPLEPAPPNFDLESRGRDVLNHLNAVVRYFRLALTPIQKVGEPSDLLYREQALAGSRQIADFAFQSARAEAALLVAYQKQAGKLPAAESEGESQKLLAVRVSVGQRLQDLKAQQKTVDDSLAHARPKQVAALKQQQEQLEGAIELNTAMNDALGKIVGMSDTKGAIGLAADIERLQRSVPELNAASSKAIVPQQLENLGAARSAGVSSKAQVLFQLLATRHSIDAWLTEGNTLHDQAMTLRTPLTNIVRSLVQSGQALSQQTEQGITAPGSTPTSTVATVLTDAATLKAIQQRYDSMTATFNTVSSAVVPLTEEMIALEQSRSNLLAWRTAVDTEYNEILRDLLVRVFVIALALGILVIVGEIWRRATVRYVRDIRRRRQLLIMRRIVLGFMGGLIVIFGFVTDFTSLATFAGFITAGLAVGLQTILLSVAAYFFIVGRFGVRVGDRISVAGVTGDVIDVGLVRFYMMELAGSGTELQPTGRVAVFSNSVLFQAGTPLYKQMPGAEYAWHELTVKLALEASYGTAGETIVRAVTAIYNDYSPGILRQYRDVQAWMDLPTDAPTIESRLQLVEGGLQLWVRYPVEIQKAAEIDERVTQAMLHLISADDTVKAAVKSPPAIRAVVKG